MRFKGKFSNSNFLKKVSLLSSRKDKEELKEVSENDSNGDERMNCCGDAPVNRGWLTGRRIVEFDILVEGLKKCFNCSAELLLQNIVRENVYGLGSIFYIECKECGAENTVHSGKRHTYKTGEDGRNACCFDVNTKLAAAMIHAGVGEQQINSILAELNLPTLSHKSLKKREREAGHSFEMFAETSCNQAVEEEIEMISELKDNGIDATTQVSSDGAWQRQGTGHENNSLSGHVTMTGRYTKKCVSYSVAKKRCRFCQRASKEGKRPRKHSCRQNWSGSSKGMEPFLTIKSLSKLKKQGFSVKKLAMDDDSTTFMRAKQAFPDIQKLSDRNHVAKNFTNELYKLKGTHSLSIKTITYLRKCFSYAVSQNQANSSGLKNNLSAIVPHAFGEHIFCDISWCNYKKNPANYKHSSLPHGKDLCGEELRSDLDSLIKKYTNDEMILKLTNMQSTNSNENLNSMISRKAPKTLHLSDSESLDIRIAAAISQKNDGHMYITKVNETHGLSPGHFTKKHFAKLDKSKARLSLFKNSTQFKKKRLQLKQSRKSDDITKAVVEGPTYESNISNDDTVTHETIEPIPDELTEPQITADATGSELIVFDVETTGFGNDCEIIQIAAKHVRSENTFSTYVEPKKVPIPRKIVHLTGIEIHGRNMYHNLEPVESVCLNDALISFGSWIQKYTPVVLLAHNANFDARFLVSSILKTDRHELLQHISGFVDTVRLFKEYIPGRGRNEYNQASLVKDLLQTTYDEHNAVAYVRALCDLFLHLESTANIDLYKQIIYPDKVVYSVNRLSNEKRNIPTYDAVKNTLLSCRQIKNLSGRGFTLRHLQLIYLRSGADGLLVFLKKKIAKPEQISSDLADYFRENK